MKRVGIIGSSLLARVLAAVLPSHEQGISLASPEDADVIVLDIDNPDDRKRTTHYDSNTPLVALSFLDPAKAVLEPSLISFDSSAAYFLEKPFSLSCLRKIVLGAPDERFTSVFANSGVNLYWHLYNCLYSLRGWTKDDLFKSRLRDLFPELLELYLENSWQCLSLLPEKIICSFYSGLAHKSGQCGLEGCLSILGRVANDCFERPDTLSDEFRKEAVSFLNETAEERNSFARQLEYLKILRNLGHDDAKNTIVAFLDAHQKIQNAFSALEEKIEEAKKGSEVASEVGNIACEAGMLLHQLLDMRQNIQQQALGDAHISSGDTKGREHASCKACTERKGDKRDMKILLIDDEPDKRLEAIQGVFKEIDPESEVLAISQNDEVNIKPALKECDFVVLDWFFPAGYPQGEETLALIRRLGYSGPLLIYSKSFGKFDAHIGPEKADDYHCEAFGILSLRDTVKKILQGRQKRAKKIPITETDSVPDLIFYPDRSSMESHFYHPCSTKSDATFQEIEEAKQKVMMLSSGWRFKYDGTSKCREDGMGNIIETVERIADLNVPVLILGDTGTGKELVAKLLHYHHRNKGKRYGFEEGKKGEKGRKSDWYIALNCGTFSENLLDVELFGAIPGAFTDAVPKAGVFEQVTQYDKDGNSINGGTVFLDELGLMKKDSQAFLLRVLQENWVYRMGHDEKIAHGAQEVQAVKKKIDEEYGKIPDWLFGRIPVEFRLVTATNEDLFSNVREGKFRMDLFFRLNTSIIVLPPLSKRSIQDFNLLFQFFLDKYNQKFKRNVTLSSEGNTLTEPSKELIAYLWSSIPWIGNVRELEGLVAGMVAYSDKNRSNPLGPQDISESYREMMRELTR